MYASRTGYVDFGEGAAEGRKPFNVRRPFSQFSVVIYDPR